MDKEQNSDQQSNPANEPTPDKTITIQATMIWHPVSDPPKKKFGWYVGAILPVNWKDADPEKVQGWRDRFGFDKVWYNESSMNRWWFSNRDALRSEPLGDRITHWAELPPVPPFAKEGA